MRNCPIPISTLLAACVAASGINLAQKPLAVAGPISAPLMRPQAFFGAEAITPELVAADRFQLSEWREPRALAREETCRDLIALVRDLARAAPEESWPRLTEKQSGVVRLLAQADVIDVSSLASRLGISRTRFEDHIKAIRRRWNRSELERLGLSRRVAEALGTLRIAPVKTLEELEKRQREIVEQRCPGIGPKAALEIKEFLRRLSGRQAVAGAGEPVSEAYRRASLSADDLVALTGLDRDLRMLGRLVRQVELGIQLDHPIPNKLLSQLDRQAKILGGTRRAEDAARLIGLNLESEVLKLVREILKYPQAHLTAKPRSHAVSRLPSLEPSPTLLKRLRDASDRSLRIRRGA